MTSVLGQQEQENSICITNFNTANTIRESLGSVLGQIGHGFEVVVVDQASDDGSLSLLEEYARRGDIRLFRQNVHNRGLGRQLAFEKSTGKYIISNIDMDDIYEPKLRDLLECYHREVEGMVLRVVNLQRRGAITISPRALIEEMGGWKDLDYVEDRYIWGLACVRGKYRWAEFPVYRRITESREKRSVRQRIGRLYGLMRDRERIGARRRYGWYTLPIFAFAFIAAKRSPTISLPIFKNFWPDDPKYKVAIDRE